MNRKKILTENDIRNIVRDEISKLVLEGIDFNIDQKTGKRTVSVNDSHQNYVDTNNSNNPYWIVDNVCGYRALSIFQRNIESNPLLNALKKYKGWELLNAKQDLLSLLKKFVAASKLLPKYDTIIMTPSNNELNKIVFDYLVQLVKHDYYFENFFEKLKAKDVYNNMINKKYIEENFEDPSRVYSDIIEAFSKMETENNGYFSYKYLQQLEYRDIIIQSLKIHDGCNYNTDYSDAINGKDVLVFDDTITTGKTISDSGKAIKDMFTPKSITYITLFSALNSGEKKYGFI